MASASSNTLETGITLQRDAHHRGLVDGARFDQIDAIRAAIMSITSVPSDAGAAADGI